ncbi:unnamed protein product, partial [marine sediment metagenome]
MILSLILPTAGLFLAAVVNLLADLLIVVVRFIADLNISQILIGKVPIDLVILYYAIIIFAAFCYFKRPAIKKIAVTVMVLLLLVSLATIKWQRTYHNNLTLNCLDVGHGQAIVMQLPPNETIVFDTGSLSKSNVEGRILQ